MRRPRLRAALLVVVAAALGSIGYLASRSVLQRRADPLRALGADLLPDVTQRIQNFRRVKVEAGRTVWEITATDAQYFRRSNEIVVHEPRVRFFLEAGRRECRVSGAEGRLTLDESRELHALTLRGGVAVHLDDLEVETAEATYERGRDVITSPGLVTIRGPSLELRGMGMEIDVGPQQVRLLEAVHTTLRADARS
jgi:LPS export ABC transporter protein LptC